MEFSINWAAAAPIFSFDPVRVGAAYTTMPALCHLPVVLPRPADSLSPLAGRGLG